MTFEDLRHAVWAVWQLDTDAHVLAPDSLRTALRDRLARPHCHPSPLGTTIETEKGGALRQTISSVPGDDLDGMCGG
ncbi:hypothetical protein ABZV94_41685, partial [Streptomyces sp. NPDC004658]